MAATVAVFPLPASSSSRIGSTLRPPGIYVMNADGSGAIRLTAPGFTLSPAWSPDGTRIAFDGQGGMYVMKADGSGVKRLLKSASFARPAWSPDGKKIAFTRWRGDQPDIYVMNANGRGIRKLSRPHKPGRNEPSWAPQDPKWSPDGRRIVFTSGTEQGYELYVMNTDGSHVRRLTRGTSTSSGNSSWNPSWSPDGTKIVCTEESGLPPADIYLLNADGSHQTNLTGATSPAGAINDEAAWSPDGKMIAFSSSRDPESAPLSKDTFYDIYLIKADGTGLTRLTSDPGEEDTPAWSPDGTKIAFSLNYP